MPSDEAILRHKAKWETLAHPREGPAGGKSNAGARKGPPEEAHVTAAKERRAEGRRLRRPVRPGGVELFKFGGRWDVRPPPVTMFTCGFHASTVGVDPYFRNEGAQWIKAKSFDHSTVRARALKQLAEEGTAAVNNSANLAELGYELRARRRLGDYGLGAAGRSRRLADEIMEKEYPLWGNINAAMVKDREDREQYMKKVEKSNRGASLGF